MCELNAKGTSLESLVRQSSAGISAPKETLRAVGLAEKFKVPDYIEANLRHAFRPYQVEALENYILATSTDKSLIALQAKIGVDPKRHLFHMATGSGKTLVMASVILHLHALGFRRFLFLTNSVNLINKTKSNLIPDMRSPKCELKETINIGGNNVLIKEVKRLSPDSTGSFDIEIMFSTIHSIHDAWNVSKENNMTEDDFSKAKIAILADEAHHFNASTKSGKEEENTWEDTIKKILSKNALSRLIEFTATMDLRNKDMFLKYKDRIVFDYTLSRFREDGYSKDIRLVKMAEETTQRALVAVMVSQYRTDLAEDNSIAAVRPKILFKCQGEIKDLEKTEKSVLDAIATLQNIDARQLLSAHQAAYPGIKEILDKYPAGKSFNDFVERVKINYQKGNSIVIHSANKAQEKAQKMDVLNSIDSRPNTRMVFAINILNEGWDVLSLFDIVKMDDIPKKADKTSTSEVQLIGRGARICPYSYADKTRTNAVYDKYKRKFDGEESNPLRHLETMCFYSVSGSDYIESLKKGLVESGLMARNPPEIKNVESRVAKGDALTRDALTVFATSMFDNGVVFTNETESKFHSAKSLSEFNIKYDCVWDENDGNIGLSDEKMTLNPSKTNTVFLSSAANTYPHIVLKALRRHPAWSVNAANSSMPFIKSEMDILSQMQGLDSDIAFKIVGKTFAELPFVRKLTIIGEAIDDIAKQVERKKNIRIGKRDFTHVMKISKVFRPYTKDADNVSAYGTKITGKNARGEQIKKSEPGIMKSKLFYYDHISWDSELELELYRLFDENLSEEDSLVIRNEVGFKLFGNTEGEHDGEGFEPDFIVLRKGTENVIYQYFIEVKDENSASNDDNAWKQELLDSLNDIKPITHDGLHYKLVGLPFFTQEDKASGPAKEYAESLTIESAKKIGGEKKGKSKIHNQDSNKAS